MDDATHGGAARRGTTFQAISFSTHSRVEFKDITSKIQEIIARAGIEGGVCHVFVPHTSAAILVNENADASLERDFDAFLAKLAPRDAAYHHDDGNCDAHLKAAVIGPSKTMIVDHGRLALGRWQGVFLCEFDGPRRREVYVKVITD